MLVSLSSWAVWVWVRSCVCARMERQEERLLIARGVSASVNCKSGCAARTGSTNCRRRRRSHCAAARMHAQSRRTGVCVCVWVAICVRMSSVYQTEPPTHGKVLVCTSHGDIDIELWPTQAPRAVRNFVQLCLEGVRMRTRAHTRPGCCPWRLPAGTCL
ncbi:hypothetical protein EON67_08735 [archaeon]|nr:MAG: hypothetical protein EON67_08735 [archaeon]